MLQLEGVSAAYGAIRALTEVSIKVAAGQFGGQSVTVYPPAVAVAKPVWPGKS